MRSVQFASCVYGRASIKLTFSKLDHENLVEKVKEWRQQRSSVIFFFRGYGEVVAEDNMGSVNGMESDIEVLLDELYFGSYYKGKNNTII